MSRPLGLMGVGGGVGGEAGGIIIIIVRLILHAFVFFPFEQNIIISFLLLFSADRFTDDGFHYEARHLLV